jgi:putative transposase
MDWPYSTFHRYVKSGLLVADWAGETNENGSYGEQT